MSNAFTPVVGTAMTRPRMGSASKPVVSIVIPTRNRLAYLKEAVASVQRQTFTRWELLIVDDASEDETPTWLRSLDDPRIRVFDNEGRVERSAARNRGLGQALGDYVTFLDDDDMFRPRALEILADALARHPDTAIACGARIEFDDTGQRRRAPHVRKAQLRALWPELLGGWVAGPGEVMFRTHSLRSIGGWDESLMGVEDWELLLRASYRLGPVYLHPYPVREWRRHGAQWRHRDTEETLWLVARSFVEGLPDRQRRLGEGALRLRARFLEAQVTLHSREDPRQALRLFVDAYRAAPVVARSPMFRMRFIRGMTQALFASLGGPGAHHALESARRGLLRRLRWTPGHEYPLKSVGDSALRDVRSGQEAPARGEPPPERGAVG